MDIKDSTDAELAATVRVAIGVNAWTDQRWGGVDALTELSRRLAEAREPYFITDDAVRKQADSMLYDLSAVCPSSSSLSRTRAATKTRLADAIRTQAAALDTSEAARIAAEAEVAVERLVSDTAFKMLRATWPSGPDNWPNCEPEVRRLARRDAALDKEASL